MKRPFFTRCIALILLVCLMIPWAGCTSPDAMLGQLAPGLKTEPKAPQKSADKQSTSEKDKATQTAPVKVDVKEVTSQIHRAEEDVKKRFQGFLERKPLKFSVDKLLVSSSKLLKEATFTLSHLESHLPKDHWKTLLFSLYSLILTLMFIIGFALADKQIVHLAMRLQSAQHARLPGWTTHLLRSLTLLLGRLTASGIFLGLSYFPIQALFAGQLWAKALSDTFWVILLYRAMEGILEVVFALPLFSLSDSQNQKLCQRIGRGIQISILAFLLLTLSKLFALPPEIDEFLRFTFLLVIASLPMLLSTLHDDLLAALPDGEPGSAYTSLRNIIDRYFYWLLLLTVGILVMRAFGYTRASHFILVRGYGLFLFLTVGSLLFSKGRSASAKYLENYEAGDAQGDLIRSVRSLTLAFCVLMIFSFSLKLVGLYEPVVLLLKTPLVNVQSVQFSLYNALSAAVIVGVAALISKILRAVLNARIYPSLGIEIGVAYAVNTLLGYAIIVIGFFMVLIALGVNLSALTVVIASLSVGIGFGLQTLTENLVSGFIILFGRAVRKGDFVSVNNIYGRVEAVGARSVVVRTMDNYDLLIPSKELVGGTIINWTYRDSLIRMHLPVGVTYNANPREVEKLLIQAAALHPHVLENPKPEVWFVDFGDSAIKFELLIYFDCRQTMADRLRGELYFHVWDVLAEAGIEIPFPQRDLHLRSTDILPQIREMMGQQQVNASAKKDPTTLDESVEDATEDDD